MKTLTKTLFAAALTALLFTSSVATTFAAEPGVPKAAASLANFKRVWVSGNVKLILTQGDEQSISGEENYDATKTSVTSDGRTLFINSMELTPVTLKITVKDLERIEAYGQSVVITSNNFNVKNLQLFLNQSATAKIKTTATSLYTVVKEDAVLKLNGTADQSTLVASNMKNIKQTDFVSQRSSSSVSEAISKADQTETILSK